METIRNINIASCEANLPEGNFVIADEDPVELIETAPNRDAYPGCLVDAMRDANRGVSGAREAIGSTIVAGQGNDIAMACGKCGISIIRDSGIVYGASKCPDVISGQKTLGELA